MLNRVVNVCSKVMGEQQESLNQLYECHVARQARTIAGDVRHILARNYDYLPSGRRFRNPNFRTLRTKYSLSSHQSGF